MRRFAANLGHLFRELPLLERFAAARRTGFTAVELLSPEGIAAESIAAAARDAGVQVVLCNSPVGDLMSEGLGLSGVPGRQAQFREAMHGIANFAHSVGCPTVNIGPSRVANVAERAACLGVLTDNLGVAGSVLGEHGIRALIEPLNSRAFEAVLLTTVDDAMAAIKGCGHPNVGLQFDIYHMHQMHSDALAELETHGASVRHIQFADVPGRGAPGTGSIDFERFFSTVDRIGYAGWLGAEYVPAGRTEETLGWLERYGSPSHELA
jgi:hydroxypyruvate isomerase